MPATQPIETTAEPDVEPEAEVEPEADVEAIAEPEAETPDAQPQTPSSVPSVQGTTDDPFAESFASKQACSEWPDIGNHRTEPKRFKDLLFGP